MKEHEIDPDRPPPSSEELIAEADRAQREQRWSDEEILRAAVVEGLDARTGEADEALLREELGVVGVGDQWVGERELHRSTSSRNRM